MATEIEGRNGGKLIAREKGDPGVPGAGRKRNPFKEVIREMSDLKELDVIVWGRLVNDQGVPVGDRVKVQVSLPSVEAVVFKAFRQAAKGNPAARKWLTETGYDKTIKLGNDEDSPLGGGFVLVLPENKR